MISTDGVKELSALHSFEFKNLTLSFIRSLRDEFEMKFLIVSQLYSPDNFRINDIVEELLSRGHSVKVVTGLPDYATSKIPKEFKWFRNRRVKQPNYEVVRLPMIARRHGIFFRVLNYTSFMISGWLYLKLCRKENYDAIFSYGLSPVLQIVPAIGAKKRFHKKLVLYCLDLWPESLKAWNLEESSGIFRFMKNVSGKIYRSCDSIAVTSRPFVEYLSRVCLVPEERMSYLPQHCEDLYKEISGVYEENGCIDFLFAGNIGAVQNVDCLIRAAAVLPPELSFRVHIVGSGSELENCKKLAESLHASDKVVFHGRHPVEKMADFYRMADCFLLPLQGGNFIGQTLPAKAQGYLSAGKPILGAIEGAGAEMIAESGCGDAVAPGDYKALAGKMTRVIERFEEYKEKGIRGRRFFEENYTKEIFFDGFMALFGGQSEEQSKINKNVQKLS